MELEISKLKLDGGTQTRAVVDATTVEDYAEAMKNGVEFPAVVVFHDGENYWLADGFHRVKAAKSNEATVIESDIRQGTQRDAILYSVSANAGHGLRRTNADKRRAVLVLLNDTEWSAWSDNEVARRCQVSPPFVAKARKELTINIYSEPVARTFTTKYGTTSTMNTGSIGSTTREKPALPKGTPPSVADKVDNGQIGVVQAIALTEAYEKASPAIQAAVVSGEIDNAAMVNYLEEKKDTETVQALLASRVLQPGDEEGAKPLADMTLLDLSEELKTREKEHRRAGQEAKREAVMKSIQSFPTDVFSVIYADPPWEYSNSGWQGSAESHYPTMHIDDICAMGDKIKTPENAALLLWATNPLLPEAFKVMKAWGFEYKSNMVWVKDKSVYGPLPQYTYGRHELLLIAVKGSFRPITMLDSVLEQAKGRHSEKPRLYASIETMYPDQHYLELFAREVEARANWTFWGGEVNLASAA